MSEFVDLWEKPQAGDIYMFAGWHQWADAGSVSSGLPHYLIRQSKARPIGMLRPDGFYLFQIPGTHDLVRPMIKFEKGYPESLQTQRNEIFYAGDDQHGLVFFLGDEPHLDAERYVGAFLEVAKELKVKRIIGLGGVYGELPYEKERMVSCIYSLPKLREEVEHLGVNLSDYQGGASIESYICRRAGEQGLEFVAFYAFVPSYDFSSFSQIGKTIRIENDFMAWHSVMKRINYMLKLNMDLTDLERKGRKLIQLLDAEVEELESGSPQAGVREYLDRLSAEFTEVAFEPLDDFWEEKLRGLFDKLDPDEEEGSGE